MSSATATVPTRAVVSSERTTRPVWQTGALATLAGAAVTEAFTLAARAIDIPMKAADPGVEHAKDIPVGGVAMAVLMWALVGTLWAAALLRWTRHPARIFVLSTVTFTALSLLGPAFAAHTETATKVVLAVAHVVAAAVVVPPLARRLSAGDND